MANHKKHDLNVHNIILQYRHNIDHESLLLIINFNMIVIA